MIDERILKNEERAVYALRSLYNRFGYHLYKMSKFEEYDFYATNKDFLISDGIITFTDKTGKLLALKPDVTLSIVKNCKDEGDTVEKFYYNENVYRVNKGSHNFKEIMQTGLECVGNIGLYESSEVLMLAVKSLSLMHEECVLDLSHAGLLSALLDEVSDSVSVKNDLLDAISKKSADAAEALAAAGKIKRESLTLLAVLMAEYKDADSVKAALSPYLLQEASIKAFEELYDILKTLEALSLGKYLNVSFSLIGNTSYYSGIVFQGYIKGIPDRVLSGGRYDGLMQKLGKRAGAIGFAVYLDNFERFGEEVKDYDVDVLLVKEDGVRAEDVILAVEELSKDGSTVLVQSSPSEVIRCKRLVKLGREGMVK